LRWPSLSRQARAVAEKYSWNAYLEEVEALLFDFVKLSPQAAHTTSAVMPALSATQKMP